MARPKVCNCLGSAQDCSPELPHDTAASCRITPRSRDHPSPTAVIAVILCALKQRLEHIITCVPLHLLYTPHPLTLPQHGRHSLLRWSALLWKSIGIVQNISDIVWRMSLTSIKRSQETILENLVNVFLQLPGFAKPCVSGNLGNMDIAAILPLLLGTPPLIIRILNREKQWKDQVKRFNVCSTSCIWLIVSCFVIMRLRRFRARSGTN